MTVIPYAIQNIHNEVICLHGYKQNGQIFRQKLGGFRKLLKSHVDFYFLDAPHLVAGDSDKNERSWGSYSKCDTSSSGLEESINVFKEACKNHGPFDGLLGFSQGAIFAAILCSFKIISLKYVVLIAGYKSQIPSHSIYYEKVIEVPSLHVMGETDAIVVKRRSEELRDCFDSKSAETITHDGGHCVPANKNLKQLYISFIEKYA